MFARAKCAVLLGFFGFFGGRGVNGVSIYFIAIERFIIGFDFLTFVNRAKCRRQLKKPAGLARFLNF